MKDDRLPIPAEELLELADRYQTPLYCYSEQVIRRQCRSLKQLYNGLPVEWLYALKANDNPHLVRIIHSEGFGLDTVSYEEVCLALQMGVPARDLLYTENNMSDVEMDSTIQDGVLLNIGSLARMKAFCHHPQARRCSLRVNPAIGDGHHSKVVTGNEESKFGIHIDQLPECRQVAEKQGVAIEGLHVHIGSGIRNPQNFLSAMQVLLNVSRSFSGLKFLNFGGGFPVAYHPDDTPFDLQELERITDELLRGELQQRPQLCFFMEPGRWLAAPAGVLLARVTDVKQQGGKRFAGVDTGFNHLLRPALYNAYHHVTNLSKRGQPVAETYDIAGNICESGDVLGTSRSLPETLEGDILAFHDAGAYGMTMASRYNRRRLPAEVLVGAGGRDRLIYPNRPVRDEVQRYLQITGFEPGPA